MNISDKKLIISLLLLGLFLIFLLSFLKTDNEKVAKVYYNNELVKTITFNEDKEYIINGYIDDVVIEVKNKAIRVIEEKSPRNLCQKQGWIKEEYETIICLPNKVVIKIEKNNELDAVIK